MEYSYIQTMTSSILRCWRVGGAAGEVGGRGGLLTGSWVREQAKSPWRGREVSCACELARGIDVECKISYPESPSSATNGNPPDLVRCNTAGRADYGAVGGPLGRAGDIASAQLFDRRHRFWLAVRRGHAAAGGPIRRAVHRYPTRYGGAAKAEQPLARTNSSYKPFGYPFPQGQVTSVKRRRSSFSASSSLASFRSSAQGLSLAWCWTDSGRASPSAQARRS